MNERHSRPPPTVIEEEPAHEFYARIVGKNVPPPTTAAYPPIQNLVAEENYDGSSKWRRTEVRQEAPTRVAGRPPRSPPPHLVPLLKNCEGESEICPMTDAARLYRDAISNSPPRLSALSLDWSNRGFHMLARMGWSERGGGLGKDRDGRMAPVETFFKIDTKGLGSHRGKPRITHVRQDAHSGKGGDKKKLGGPRCGEIGVRTSKHLRREANLLQCRRDRVVRMVLRDDVPPELERLYIEFA